MDELLTTEEAAEFLKLSPHTLTSWRRAKIAGTLPYVEVGGVVRYRRSDIEAWLDAQTIKRT